MTFYSCAYIPSPIFLLNPRINETFTHTFVAGRLKTTPPPPPRLSASILAANNITAVDLNFTSLNCSMATSVTLSNVTVSGGRQNVSYSITAYALDSSSIQMAEPQFPGSGYTTFSLPSDIHCGVVAFRCSINILAMGFICSKISVKTAVHTSMQSYLTSLEGTPARN